MKTDYKFRFLKIIFVLYTFLGPIIYCKMELNILYCINQIRGWYEGAKSNWCSIEQKKLNVLYG